MKQYKEYGVKKLPKSEAPNTTSTADGSRDSSSNNTSQKPYTVKSGDCLWNIAKAAYGDGSKWRVIYNANKTLIEETAKKYGRKSSQDGHWTYPGTVLTIPGLNNANLEVQKLKNGSSSSNKTYTVTITTSGVAKARGQITIEYTRNGKKMVSKNTDGGNIPKESVSATCDANTQVKVIVAKSPIGYDFTVINKTGNWTKYSDYRYDLKITKNYATS